MAGLERQPFTYMMLTGGGIHSIVCLYQLVQSAPMWPAAKTQNTDRCHKNKYACKIVISHKKHLFTPTCQIRCHHSINPVLVKRKLITPKSLKALGAVREIKWPIAQSHMVVSRTAAGDRTGVGHSGRWASEPSIHPSP